LTDPRIGLVLIPRHVCEEINYLTPASGSGIEQELTVGCGHRSSFIDLLLRRNSMNKVDRLFVESGGHLYPSFGPIVLLLMYLLLEKAGVNPFILQKLKYVWSP